MGSTAYGFVTINDHGDFSGDGQLTFSVQTHTGRNGRTKMFDLDADHGGQANIEVEQSAAGVIMAIDRFEDENGDTVEAIDHAGGLYYMCGHANVDFLEASEPIDTPQTDLNDPSGAAWTNGFTITEANGTVHTGIMFESSIAYGTDAQYTFRIPVVFQKTNTKIDITFELTDDVNTVTYTIAQNAET